MQQGLCPGKGLSHGSAGWALWGKTFGENMFRGLPQRLGAPQGLGASPPVGLCQIFLSHIPFPKTWGNPRDKDLALILLSPLPQVLPMKLNARRVPERPG